MSPILPIHLLYGFFGMSCLPLVQTFARSYKVRVLAYGAYLIIHQIFLWPYFLSPLRDIPGPPLGNPILGQSPTIIKSETGIPQREWVKKYGPVVRVVGPIGIERMIFMKPEALHQILVKDWLECPRVCMKKDTYLFRY
jgi:hypothetical protein